MNDIKQDLYVYNTTVNNEFLQIKMDRTRRQKDRRNKINIIANYQPFGRWNIVGL